MTDYKAITINNLIDAVEAIERELGLVPSGVYSNVRARLDILEGRINNPNIPSPTVQNPFTIGNSGVTIQTGVGDPNTTVSPPPQAGSLYLRQDGNDAQGLYSFRPDNTWVLIGGSLITNNIITVTADYTATTSDYIILIGMSPVLDEITITLPNNPPTGTTFVIKDQLGLAEVYEYTINANSSTIDGNSIYSIIFPYETVNLVYTGSSWSIL